MSFSFIISSRNVTAFCLECDRPYWTELVTDSMGEYIRNGQLCEDCLDEAYNEYENNAYDYWHDR